MLDSAFKHKHWFKGETITVKQFLDYVLANDDFIIQQELKSLSNVLGDCRRVWVLSDRRYTMPVTDEMAAYLMQNSAYFKQRMTVS